MSYITINPSGLLDSTTADQMRCSINDAIKEGAEIILIDFQHVTFMNSSAIGALVASLKSVNKNGKLLSICSLNPQLTMIFELTRMDDIFAIHKDKETFEYSLVDGVSEEKDLSYI